MKNTKLRSKKTLNLKSALLFLGLTFLLLAMPACEQDTNPDINLDTRSEFLGRWEVLENTGINAPQVYNVQISEGTNPDEIVINGIYNISNVKVSAVVSEFSLSIPLQESEGITFSGTGEATVDFDQITLNFTANDGSGDDTVEAILSK